MSVIRISFFSVHSAGFSSTASQNTRNTQVSQKKKIKENKKEEEEKKKESQEEEEEEENDARMETVSER